MALSTTQMALGVVAAVVLAVALSPFLSTSSSSPPSKPKQTPKEAIEEELKVKFHYIRLPWLPPLLVQSVFLFLPFLLPLREFISY
jgi:hypothetical protein